MKIIEDVARALCTGRGIDPDEMVTGVPAGPTRARWTMLEDEAAEIVRAHGLAEVERRLASGDPLTIAP